MGETGRGCTSQVQADRQQTRKGQNKDNSGAHRHLWIKPPPAQAQLPKHMSPKAEAGVPSSHPGLAPGFVLGKFVKALSLSFLMCMMGMTVRGSASQDHCKCLAAGRALLQQELLLFL